MPSNPKTTLAVIKLDGIWQVSEVDVDVVDLLKKNGTLLENSLGYPEWATAELVTLANWANKAGK